MNIAMYWSTQTLMLMKSREKKTFNVERNTKSNDGITSSTRDG